MLTESVAHMWSNELDIGVPTGNIDEINTLAEIRNLFLTEK